MKLYKRIGAALTAAAMSLTFVLGGISQMPLPTVRAEETVSEEIYSNWQEAYTALIRQKMKSDTANGRFSLCYVDDNDVPELVLHGEGTAHFNTDVYLYTYCNRRLIDLGTQCNDGCSNFSYRERTGEIMTGFTNSGVTTGGVAVLSEGKLTTTHSFELVTDYLPYSNVHYEVDGVSYETYDEAWDVVESLFNTMVTETGAYAMTEQNIRQYILKTLKGTDLAAMPLSGIVRLMDGSYSLNSPGPDGCYYIKNAEIFPNLWFCINDDDYSSSESALRKKVENDTFSLYMVEINQTGAWLPDDPSVSYQVTDSISSKDTYKQCASVLGDFDCTGTPGVFGSGDFGGVCYQYEDEGCSITLNFAADYGDTIEQSMTNGIVPAKVMNQVNPDLWTVWIRKSKEQRCGDNAFWKLDENGVLTIYGTGAMWDYDSYADGFAEADAKFPPYLEKTYYTIVVEEGITDIGNWAFQCWFVKEISLPESLITIGDYAFMTCGYTKEITIPASVQSIGEGALYCYHWEPGALERVTILNPDCIIYDSENTIAASYWENYGEHDRSQTPSNTVICSYEDSTAQAYAEKYDRPFEVLEEKYQCGDDLWVTITDGIATIDGSGDMWDFDNTKAEVGKGKQSPFTKHKEQIIDVVIEEHTAESIGDYAFEDCSSINASCFYLYSGISRIGDGAFKNCSGIQYFEFRDTVQVIGTGAFENCRSIKSFDVVPENPYLSSENGVLYDKEQKTLICFPARPTWLSADSEDQAGNHTFSIPSSVETIRAAAFDSTQDLEILTIPNPDVQIAVTAFDNSSIKILMGQRGSQVESYASHNLLSFATLNGFVPDKNGNSFSNSNKTVDDGFYGHDDYTISDTLLASDSMVKKRKMKDKWDGCCYGIAVTMALEFNGNSSITSLSPGTACYHDMEKPYTNSRFIDTITAYHLSQYTFKKDHLITSYGPVIKQDTEIQKMVRELLKGEAAYVLTYNTKDFFKTNTDHAILAYGCIYDEISDEYLISLYDMNRGGCNTVMHVSSDYSVFYFVDALGFMIGNCPGYRCNRLQMTDIRTIDDIVEDYHYNIMTNANATITNSENETLTIEDAVVSGTMAYEEFVVASGEESHEKTYCQIEPSPVITAKFEESVSSLAIYDNNDSYYFESQGENINNVKVDFSAASLTLTGDAMTFTAFLATDSAVGENETGLVSVSGTTDGTVTLSAENGIVTMQADNPVTNLSIASYVSSDVIRTSAKETDSLSFTVKADGNTDLPASYQPGNDSPDASDTKLLRAEDQLTYDDDGTVRYLENGIAKTGKFSLSPNYLLGDISGDGDVNAADATYILQGAAQSGATGADTGTILSDEIASCTSASQAFSYADINADDAIDAGDATLILIYAAQAGADQNAEALGTCHYYAGSDGILRKGLIEDAEGSTYYADETYRLVSGWVTVGDTDYCFDEQGILQKNCWEEHNGDRCYLDQNGQIATGWQTIEDSKYYFDENGASVTGFMEIDETEYCFDDNGILCMGMYEIDGELYWFDPTDGHISTGWLTDDEETFFAYCQDGKVLHDCWIDAPEDGSLASSMVVYGESGESTVYQATPYGKGTRYYAGNDYIVLSGYQTIDGNLYYFEPVYGFMHKLDIQDDYLIGADGICREIPKGGSGNKTKDAAAVAQVVADCIDKEGTDLETVAQAAYFVSLFSQTRCTYTMSGNDYATAYGVFVKGEYSCAGSTRALGLVLQQMGYNWTHVNENQYSHQWCKLTMDGQVGFADGQVGYVGYGTYTLAG